MGSYDAYFNSTMAPRLPTHLVVAAVVRQVMIEGRFAAVPRKGEVESGMIGLIMNLMDGTALVYTQMRNIDGVLGWFPALKGKRVTEYEASAYMSKAADSDPDLWIVEIEDPDGKIPFEGPLL